MEAKKEFEMPELEVIRFHDTDVICTSGFKSPKATFMYETPKFL